MPTRMFHPQHGWTHAYDTGEVARLVGLGWAVEAPDALQAAVTEVIQPEPQKKKPGRPAKAK